ncbi:MAG: type I methionyl aminopeptidase [Chloroflexota bacterium]
MVTRKSKAEIERMRTAGRVVAEVLALVESELRPGITTGELDRLGERHIKANGMTPSFKGYLGGGQYGNGPHAYPATLCISIDDEVVHGIPGDRAVREGQIVSVDVGAIYQGWHADAARSFVVGSPSPQVAKLVETTRLAMMAGIGAAVPGNRIGDISAAIEDAAKPHGYGIVQNFVGHGIGTEMHQPPNVPNFRSGGRGIELAPGICLAIEPMLTLGSHEVEIEPDGWTVVTVDGSLAAHFEHTIAVTGDGPEILTTI